MILFLFLTHPLPFRHRRPVFAGALLTRCGAVCSSAVGRQLVDSCSTVGRKTGVELQGDRWRRGGAGRVRKRPGPLRKRGPGARISSIIRDFPWA